MGPWKKGEFESNGGLPDGLISRALREALMRRVGDEETWDGKMVVDVLVEAVVEHAIRGNWRFAQLVFEWCDGPLDRTAREFEAHPRIALNIVPAPPRLPAETHQPRNLLPEGSE
jgi:hypothetical protein